MSEEIEAIKDAIQLNKESLLEQILSYLEIDEISEEKFQDLLMIIEKEDTLRFKYMKALESQEVIESVLKDKLI